MLYILLITTFIVLLTAVILYEKSHNARYKKLPSPSKSWPLLGHLPLIWQMQNIAQNTPLTNTLHNLAKRKNLAKHGLYHLRTGFFTDLVYVFKADHADVILKSCAAPAKCFVKSAKSWFGSGILTSSDEKWRRCQTLLTTSFKTMQSSQYTLINKRAQEFCDLVLRRDGDITDIEQMCSLVVFEDVSKIIAGQKHFTLKEGATRYLLAFKNMRRLIERRLFNSLKKSFLYRLFRDGRRYLKNTSYLNQISKSVITVRKFHYGQDYKTKAFQQKRAKSVLETLFHQHEIRDKDYRNLTQVRNQMDQLMYAAIEPTTKILTGCVIELAKNPKLQEKARLEVENIVDDQFIITDEHLSQMHRIDKIVNECLRKFTPDLLITRHATQDIQLRNGVLIPKGTDIIISAPLIHMNPKAWIDPEKFDPRRFELYDKNQKNINFIPFGSGQRCCVGKELAITIIKIIISSLLRRFRLSMQETDKRMLSIDSNIQSVKFEKLDVVFNNPVNDIFS